MEQNILVFVDLYGEQHIVGQLWLRIRNGRESASFQYDQSWLKNPLQFTIDPALALSPIPFHTPSNKVLFGAFDDSSPDRWGKMLMRRNEHRRAKINQVTPRTLHNIDYLLGVDDFARLGAIRFRIELHGEFLAPSQTSRIPPLIQLPKLLSATESILEMNERDEDLRILIAPGSSLGGARPKASILDNDGQLALAKFPSNKDEIEIVKWESVALTLASKAGIDVPNWRIINVSGKSVIILRRFDRVNENRIPFLSAMSMLGATDHDENHSYMEIADVLRQYGSKPTIDLIQLWRRVVFNILISNTDDHLRNHAFLYTGQEGWRLSPAYDLNPELKDIHAISINIDNPTSSIDLALETADYYGLNQGDAKEIVKTVAKVVGSWREVAENYGIKKREIELMSPAFENVNLETSLQM